MSTAALISGHPMLTIEAGLRVLARPLVVDLGVYLAALEGVDGCARGVLVPDRTYITVPAGFRYDGASLPWWSRPVLGPDERYEVAGCCHDWLYRVQAPRDAADYVFWLVARSGEHHVSAVRGWLGWAGLRIGGWAAYRRYR